MFTFVFIANVFSEPLVNSSIASAISLASSSGWFNSCSLKSCNFDNDRAGREATKALIFALNRYNIYDIPAPYGKDINDYLCYKLGLKERQEIEQYKKKMVKNKEYVPV